MSLAEKNRASEDIALLAKTYSLSYIDSVIKYCEIKGIEDIENVSKFLNKNIRQKLKEEYTILNYLKKDEVGSNLSL